MITRLDPSQYKRTPWRNGGGVTVDIAVEGDEWRLGRTPITEPGPFSDYTGYNRLQVLVSGRGLVLDTPDGDIDVRMPFRPVRFAGETPIVSRLEAGPVEVVNLIGRRDAVAIDLHVVDLGSTLTAPRGTHFVYAPKDSATLMVDGATHTLAPDHSLRIEAGQRTIFAGMSGRVLVASIVRV
jgi:environmental stress-induced protein Ves